MTPAQQHATQPGEGNWLRIISQCWVLIWLKVSSCVTVVSQLDVGCRRLQVLAAYFRAANAAGYAGTLVWQLVGHATELNDFNAGLVFDVHSDISQRGAYSTQCLLCCNSCCVLTMLRCMP